jgi:hypothetical protein
MFDNEWMKISYQQQSEFQDALQKDKQKLPESGHPDIYRTHFRQLPWVVYWFLYGQVHILF